MINHRNDLSAYQWKAPGRSEVEHNMRKIPGTEAGQDSGQQTKGPFGDCMPDNSQRIRGNGLTLHMIVSDPAKVLLPSVEVLLPINRHTGNRKSPMAHCSMARVTGRIYPVGGEAPDKPSKTTSYDFQ
ncbi:MAG TPA: hypothetical protein VE377_25730 [Candidatus Dormibacteraeota bacterium]|nr:hypothetical protein [Terriglobales bacterium]HYM79404.1 hypothetical protein [Candidatus Dormibacteraeota bacterium]